MVDKGRKATRTEHLKLAQSSGMPLLPSSPLVLSTAASALLFFLALINIWQFIQAFLVAQMVKNLPAMHETWV